MESSRSSDLVKAAIALLDFSLIAVSFHLAVWLRFGDLQLRGEFVWLFYVSAPLILFLLLRNGVLTGFRYQPLRDIFTSTTYAFVTAGVICTAVLYLSKTGEYSRLVFAYYFALSAVLVLVEKYIVKRAFDRYLASGGMKICIAVVGFGEKFEDIVREYRERPQLGLEPVLIMDPRQSGVPDIVAGIRNSIVDEVYLVYPRSDVYHRQIDILLEQLETLGLPVRVALNFDDIESYYGQHFCRLGSRHEGVMLAPYNLDPDQLLLKRAMDLLGGLLGLMVTALMFPFIALAIKLDSPGPVFFGQERVGRAGRRLRIYKFRSMYLDAEAQKAELSGENIHQGAIFKLENDPRVTRIGRVLRKFSLDEFPQFWNVLKGEMSLVGTRPPTVDEVASYEDHHFRRISIKPGLTGLWQVSGRNSITDFDEVVALDTRYIREWNLWLDVKIVARTVMIVLFPRGDHAGL